VEDTEDIPEGMVVQVFDLLGGHLPVPPVEVSYWTLEPGADSGDDRHAVRELWLLAAGRGVMTCGDQTLEVAAGEAVSIAANQTHRLVNTGDRRIGVFSVWWSP
jgi:mannose-6-phosphate isomerase-like protein (cupin superfamily)